MKLGATKIAIAAPASRYSSLTGRRGRSGGPGRRALMQPREKENAKAVGLTRLYGWLMPAYRNRVGRLSRQHRLVSAVGSAVMAWVVDYFADVAGQSDFRQWRVGLSALA